jgi:hypothetical protein
MNLKNNTHLDDTKPNPNTLTVEIRNPDKVLFSGGATAVSSKNSIGPLDILPQHENFISLLTDNITVHLEKHQKQEIPNQSAIVKAKLNKVSIFLGIETLIAPPQNPGLNKPLPQKNSNPQPQNSK